MKIEIFRETGGWPKVAWIQTTAETGATVGARKSLWAIVVGMACGLALGISADDPTFLFAGPVFGAIAALWLRGHDEKARGGPAPADAAPILADQYCEAKIFRQDDALFFGWSLKGKRMTDAFTLPLADVTEIVVGGMNDWFADKGGLSKFHESFVIVMPLADGRVLRLADHVGGQVDVAKLHSVLSQELIVPRKRLLRALENELRERRLGTGADDIPDSY